MRSLSSENNLDAFMLSYRAPLTFKKFPAPKEQLLSYTFNNFDDKTKYGNDNKFSSN